MTPRAALGLFACALHFLPGASTAAERACALPVAVAAASTQSPRMTSSTDASDTERVRTVDQIGNTILVGTDQGLFRLRGDELTRLGGSADTWPVISVHQIGKQIFIFGELKVYRLDGDNLIEVNWNPNPFDELNLFERIFSNSAKVILHIPVTQYIHMARFTEESTGASQTHDVSDAIFIGKNYTLGRLAGDTLIPLRSVVELGSVWAVQKIGSMILVVSSSGLFRLEGNDLIQIGAGVDTETVNSIQNLGGAILVSADNGLFRLNGDDLKRIEASADIGTVYSVENLGGAPLVNADNGLFRLNGDDLELIGARADIGTVYSVQNLGGAPLVNAYSGLFRLDGDDLTRLGAGTETGRISSVQQLGGAILVSAEKGLFRLDGEDLTRLGAGTDTGKVRSVQRIGDTTLVHAMNGLFRVDGSNLTRLGSGTDTGAVRLVKQAGSVILVAGEKGLFRLDGEDLQEVKSDPPIKETERWEWIGDRLWIRSNDGMLRYTTETYRATGPDRAPAFGTGTSAALRFTLSPCLGVLPAGRFALIQDLPSPIVPTSSAPTIAAGFKSEGPPTQRVLTAAVDPLPAGTWRVRLAVRIGEEWEPVSPPVELRVDWTPGDYIRHYLLLAAPILGYAHTLVFVLLLAGARRSAWCWRVVSDPLWGRAGLWWHFALRHVPALQRWVLARWYDAVRHREARPYIPVPLAAPDGTTVAADSLLDRLGSHRRLWVQGGTGMGKSALVEDISRRFFGDHAGLHAAYRRYGFVPIVVRLRDVLDIKADPAQPDRWVPELARMAVRANGLRVDDPALFRAILESGAFALILDGANETANAAALEDYARTTPEVRILVTSQADPAKAGFELLRLPGTVEGLVGPLLALLLGSERGAAVLETVSPTPLWPELTSGYDVRLLADLAGRSGPVPDLPADRIGLYRTLLARLRYAGGPYPEAELSRAAWTMWRDGVRRFDGTKYLTADLIEPLRHEEARVVRTIGGVLYEFRHDQMRGYLAALWAARHEVAPIRLFETDKAIWRLGFSEQVVVWEFFAALVDRAGGEAIWQWCHEEPERAILQHALDRRGRQDGWTLVRRTVNAETEALPA